MELNPALGPELILAAQQNDLIEVTLLLNQGAPANYLQHKPANSELLPSSQMINNNRISPGMSALHSAIAHENLAMAVQLLEFNAQVDIPQYLPVNDTWSLSYKIIPLCKQTPLANVLKKTFDKLGNEDETMTKIADLLLNAGAKFDLVDDSTILNIFYIARFCFPRLTTDCNKSMIEQIINKYKKIDFVFSQFLPALKTRGKTITQQEFDNINDIINYCEGKMNFDTDQLRDFRNLSYNQFLDLLKNLDLVDYKEESKLPACLSTYDNKMQHLANQPLGDLIATLQHARGLLDDPRSNEQMFVASENNCFQTKDYTEEKMNERRRFYSLDALERFIDPHSNASIFEIIMKPSVQEALCMIALHPKISYLHRLYCRRLLLAVESHPLQDQKDLVLYQMANFEKMLYERVEPLLLEMQNLKEENTALKEIVISSSQQIEKLQTQNKELKETDVSMDAKLDQVLKLLLSKELNDEPRSKTKRSFSTLY